MAIETQFDCDSVRLSVQMGRDDAQSPPATSHISLKQENSLLASADIHSLNAQHCLPDTLLLNLI